MPMFPSRVDVVDGDSMRKLVDGLRAPLFQGADYIAEFAIELQPDVIHTLRTAGADETNRLGFGSSASKSADALVFDCMKAAEHLKAACEYLEALALDYRRLVSVPLEMAERARTHTGKLLRP
jgi:hypothetical protein